MKDLIIKEIIKYKGKIVNESMAATIASKVCKQQRDLISQYPFNINQTVRGRIREIKQFGALVDLVDYSDIIGISISGLLHISEISNSLVKHSDLLEEKYFKLGDILNMRVNHINKKGVGLSLKNVVIDN